jgi:hypothetical protein
LIEKVAAAQIEDKRVANDVGDAVSIAMHKLTLAESALFHAVAVNLFQSLVSFKNVKF